MAITDWPEQERPREKLLTHGPGILSDAELLAIFLRTGYRGTSAVDLARDLIADFGSLRGLLNTELATFKQKRGLGNAKYAQLHAAIEMSRRHLAEQISRSDVLDSSTKVKSFLMAHMRHLEHEEFSALLLDSQNRMIAFERLFSGTIDSAAVYPREVIKLVLKHNAAAVIFAHNHPSGMCEPSQSDHELTQTLCRALTAIETRTLDHIIVGDGVTFSFAEQGYLPR